jgi:hypothetical protein
MKKIVFVLLLVLPWSIIRAKNAATLQLLTNPTGIAVKEHHIYIADFPAIYIYSLKDFRLIKKFGRKGAGPGEFLPRSSKDQFFIYLLDETVFVESNGRVSFFTLNGDFLKEFNVAAAGYLFQPFDNRFLGKKRVVEERSVYGTLNLFDKQFKRVKEVFRVPYSIQPGKKILVFNPNDFRYHPGENYLYIRNLKEFAVKIYDKHFKLVSILKRENYTLRKILPEDKKKMHSVFKVALKERYDVLRHRITFPETFAAVRNIIVDGGKLYIITFKKQEGGVECFLYTPEGTFIQKLHIPLIFENILQYYPYTIHNGSLYQLIENEDTEEWELHVNTL